MSGFRITTRNIPVVAYLRYTAEVDKEDHGIEIERVSKDGRRYEITLFDPNDKFEDLQTRYYNGEPLGNLRIFDDLMRDIKRTGMESERLKRELVVEHVG